MMAMLQYSKGWDLECSWFMGLRALGCQSTDEGAQEQGDSLDLGCSWVMQWVRALIDCVLLCG